MLVKKELPPSAAVAQHRAIIGTEQRSANRGSIQGERKRRNTIATPWCLPALPRYEPATRHAVLRLCAVLLRRWDKHREKAKHAFLPRARFPVANPRDTIVPHAGSWRTAQIWRTYEGDKLAVQPLDATAPIDC